MAWLLRRVLALWVRFSVLPEEVAARLQAFGIAGDNSIMALFASHPPIEERIAALETRRP